jgi:predicted lysophospholipase L1 biosynthesis ABC-type transport system permease subunit
MVKIPSNMPYDVGILITMLFAVIPMLFNLRARPTRAFKIDRKPNTFNYWILVISLATILLYRIGLNNGLHFELFYDFIFSLDITPL